LVFCARAEDSGPPCPPALPAQQAGNRAPPPCPAVTPASACTPPGAAHPRTAPRARALTAPPDSAAGSSPVLFTPLQRAQRNKCYQAVLPRRRPTRPRACTRSRSAAESKCRIFRFAVQSHTEPARPQLHAVVSHYKQSNTSPMSLENHQLIYGYTCVYSISVLGLCSPRSSCATTARNCAYPPRYYCANPPLYRTLWCHTTSKATPSLCPWRTIKKYTDTLVCILSPFLGLCSPRSPCATTARNRSGTLKLIVARSPAAARCGATLQAKQYLPYVPGEPSTNIRVHLCVFYLRFWACVRRVSRVSPLHASIGEVHNLNTT